MIVGPLLRCSVKKVVVSGRVCGTAVRGLSYILDLQSRQLWNRLDNIHRKSSA